MARDASMTRRVDQLLRRVGSELVPVGAAAGLRGIESRARDLLRHGNEVGG